MQGGYVLYRANETVFAQDTIIDPENYFGHEYDILSRHHKNGEFSFLGMLEAGQDFPTN